MLKSEEDFFRPNSFSLFIVLSDKGNPNNLACLNYIIC
jgi:hypothetical protein